MKPRFLTSHYAWIQGCYWMAYCILLSFSSVYLLDQGFSNTQIGLLLGLSGLLTALLQPFVGARADHLKVLSLGQFAALLILAMLLCTGGLLLLPGQAVQGGLFLSLLILLQLLTSLLYALGMGCVNQGMPLNFGLARGVGAGSYALASTLCGSAAAAFSPKCIPVLLGGATLLLLAAALSFRPGTPAKQAAPPPASPPSSPQSFWRRYPRFLPLLAGVVLLYTSHNILMSFPYQIVQYLGGGSGEMGTLLLFYHGQYPGHRSEQFSGRLSLGYRRHRTHLGLFHCNRRDRYGHPLDHAAAGPGQSSGTAGIAYAGWVLLSCQKTVKKSSSLLDRFSSFPENIWRYRLRYVT